MSNRSWPQRSLLQVSSGGSAPGSLSVRADARRANTLPFPDAAASGRSRGRTVRRAQTDGEGGGDRARETGLSAEPSGRRTWSGRLAQAPSFGLAAEHACNIAQACSRHRAVSIECSDGLPQAGAGLAIVNVSLIDDSASSYAGTTSAVPRSSVYTLTPDTCAQHSRLRLKGEAGEGEVAYRLTPSVGCAPVAAEWDLRGVTRPCVGGEGESKRKGRRGEGLGRN